MAHPHLRPIIIQGVTYVVLRGRSPSNRNAVAKAVLVAQAFELACQLVVTVLGFSSYTYTQATCGQLLAIGGAKVRKMSELIKKQTIRKRRRLNWN